MVALEGISIYYINKSTMQYPETHSYKCKTLFDTVSASISVVKLEKHGQIAI